MARKISPTEVKHADLSDADRAHLKYVGPIRVLWSFQADFGTYLRELRDEHGWSLRRVAEQIGVMHTYVTRLEKGEKVRPPDVDLLDAMADLYGVERGEMRHHAGYSYEVPDEMNLDRIAAGQFERLLLNIELRPQLFTRDEIQLIPPLVKRQWIEFARKLAAHPDPETLINGLLAVPSQTDDE